MIVSLTEIVAQTSANFRRFMVALAATSALAIADESAAEKLVILAADLPGASEEGGTGRDAETVRRVLALCGYESEFVFQPFGRHLLTYSNSEIADAVMTVPLGKEVVGASTAAYIWYQNGAIYDSEKIPEITRLTDLAGLSVVTFKDGTDILELDDIEPPLGTLMEIADQWVHSRLLLLGRVDAILADGFIVSEINRRLRATEGDTLRFVDQSRLRFAPIFTPSPYKMVFRDAEIARAFDRCFDSAYGSGVIREIEEKYISPLQIELGHRYLGF